MHRGVFGGSFDPVHNGHLIVARAAAEALGLAQVHLIPASRQPLKQGEHGASAEHRMEMVRLAVRGDPVLRADATEVDRGGTSYMVDTLRMLRAEYPGDLLSLLIGADAAAALSEWRDVDEVTRLARIVVMTRPGATLPPGEMYDVLSVPEVDVSATDVRQRAARGDSLDGFVPESVARYIAAHGLYRRDD